MIQRLLCLLLLTSLAAPAGAATPQKIGNFSSLMDALAKGSTVRIVAGYGRCRLIEGGRPEFTPPRIGGMTVDGWRSQVEGGLGDESVTVILTDEELIVHSELGALIRHVEFEVHHDDSVRITLRHLDPDTHDVVSRWKLGTTFDRGDEGAAAFYRLD